MSLCFDCRAHNTERLASRCPKSASVSAGEEPATVEAASGPRPARHPNSETVAKSDLPVDNLFLANVDYPLFESPLELFVDPVARRAAGRAGCTGMRYDASEYLGALRASGEYEHA